MLPIHRLAQTGASGSRFDNAASWVKGHPIWSSRLATRIAILAAAFLVFIFWLLPSFSYTPTIPFRDMINGAPPGGLPGQDHSPPQVPPQVWNDRAGAVKDSFLFAYHGYEAAAFGKDELLPISNSSTQNFNGWGVSIVDSLSTLLLMGFKDEFKRGMAHVETLQFKNHDGIIPFFETVIRYLGGLLSAYALSGDPALLSRADELGMTLLPIFDSPSGIPHYGLNPSTGNKAKSWAVHALLAEIASCQMEYKYLAHLTGRSEYFFKVDKMMDLMENTQRPDGLWSTYWDVDTGSQVNNHLSVGALADSGYEYLLKQYLMTAKSEKRLLKMYLKSVNGVLENLMYLSATRDLLYVTDTRNDIPEYRLEHLSCFYGGLLALGVETLDLPQEDAELHRWAAEGLTTTCWLMYAEQESGLGGEDTKFRADFGTGKKRPVKWMPKVREWKKKGRRNGAPPGVRGAVVTPPGETRDYYLGTANYYLRPETVESIYIMWKVTKDEIWRERGWGIYEAIEKHTKTKVGYGSVSSVHSKVPAINDSMPSYFLAETLKYLYLLFSDEDPIPLDKWVFNTEAHPFPVFHWKETEKQTYHIPT